MKKIFFVFLSLFLFLPKQVFAGNDLTITCASGGSCTKSSSLPVFQESNIYPGYTKSQNVTVVNNRSTDCNLTFKAGLKDIPASILPDKVILSITKGITVWYAGSLQNATNPAGHILGVVPAGATDVYLWTASFDQDAGNDYKQKETVFDLDFNFGCEDELSTPTPTPSGGGNPAPPVCTATAPASAPVLTSIVAGTNSATLYWNQAAGPLTYYLIAFGTQSGIYLYGNPNIGGPGTASYTVTNLSAGQRYYFVVRAGNDCMPGPFSNELSVVPLGTATFTQPPSGFQEGVLGTKVNEEEQPPILGEKAAEAKKVCFVWWLVLLVQSAILGIYFYFLNKRKKWPDSWWQITLAIVIIAFFIDNYAHTHWFVLSKFCQYEIIFGIILAGMEAFIFKRIKNKK